MFRIEENGQFRGQVTFLDAKLNNGCIEDKHVSAAAKIAASKQQHQHRGIYSQERATTPIVEGRIVHVVQGTAGKALEFKAGCVTKPSGADTVTFELYKNGVTMLSAPVEINDTHSNYQVVAGVVSVETLAAGDVLEIKVTAVSGASAKGAFAYVDLEEDYS